VVEPLDPTGLSGLGHSAAVGDDGAYRAAGLAAGSYAVSLQGGPGRAGDLSLAPRTVQVAPGATVKVDFIATPGSTLRVTLTSAAGQTVEATPVLVPGQVVAPARSADLVQLLRRGARGTEDDGAAWAFTGVAAGHYTLVVLAGLGQGMGAYAQGLDADGQGTRELAVQLPEHLAPVAGP
jgi:hypothetical protein